MRTMPCAPRSRFTGSPGTVAKSTSPVSAQAGIASAASAALPVGGAKKAKARERRLERQIQSIRWIAEPQTRPSLTLACPRPHRPLTNGVG